MNKDRLGMAEAIAMAKRGAEEGGVPIGCCILNEKGEVIARGRNQRVQRGSWIHHGEMNAIENLEKPSFPTLHKASLYTTLSPCSMCSGETRSIEFPSLTFFYLILITLSISKIIMSHLLLSQVRSSSTKSRTSSLGKTLPLWGRRSG